MLNVISSTPSVNRIVNSVGAVEDGSLLVVGDDGTSELDPLASAMSLGKVARRFPRALSLRCIEVGRKFPTRRLYRLKLFRTLGTIYSKLYIYRTTATKCWIANLVYTFLANGSTLSC
jgi:hypothetical protein